MPHIIMIKLTDVIGPLIGAGIASAGYILALLSNYLFLKSPKIVATASADANGEVVLPQPGYKIGDFSYYIASITIYNYSKNYAYGFRIVSFEVLGIFQSPENLNKSLQMPVTEMQPQILHLRLGKYVHNQYVGATYNMTVEYYNELGKKYTARIIGAFNAIPQKAVWFGW